MDAAHFKNLGNEAFKAQKYEEAIVNFTKAIECNPQDHVLYSNRSSAYVNQGDYDKALEDAEKCLSLNSTWPRGYQRKGAALFYLDRLDEAINVYKAGLAIDPNNASLKQDLEAAQSKKKSPPPMFDQAYLQNIMKLYQHPETKELMKDPNMMQTLTACMQNPQLLPVLMAQDPRLKKVFEVINSPSTGNEFNFPDLNQFKGSSKPEPPPQSEPKREPTPPPKEMEVEDPAEQAKNLGNQEFKKKNFDAALKHYDSAITINPIEPLYFNNKAAVYIEMKNWEQAMVAVESAEKILNEPENRPKISDFFSKKAKVLARKASILERKGDLTAAIQMYEKSLLEDQNYKVKDSLLKLKKLKKDEDAKAYIDPAAAEQHNTQGGIHFKEGKFPQAIKEYEEAIRRNPNCAKYYSNLGTAFVKLMEFQRAKENFETALRIDPDFNKVYAKKGECHFFLKEYHKALSAFEEGLKHEPDNQQCKQGIEKTQAAIYSSSSNEDQQERAKKAMADPEIQSILQTPEVRNALADLQRDPKSIQAVMKNKNLAEKIDKLIQAGVLRIG